MGIARRSGLVIHKVDTLDKVRFWIRISGRIVKLDFDENNNGVGMYFD